MGFFFSRAKLLLSNYTSALESLCNARGGGPAHVWWIKGIAEQTKTRGEPCALATCWQDCKQRAGALCLAVGCERLGWYCHCPPSKPAQGPLLAAWDWLDPWALSPADSKDPRLMYWEEKALPEHWGVQLFFSFSVHSSPALVMDTWSYALHLSPCIIWSFFHAGLIVSFHDLVHITDALLDVSF